MVQLTDRFYFYRGIANRIHLNSSLLEFGSEVTAAVQSAGLPALLEPTAQRICNLEDGSSTVFLPVSKQFVRPEQLVEVFSMMSVLEVQGMEEDISAAVPQLQMLLKENELLKLSHALVEILVKMTTKSTLSTRTAYMNFLTWNWDKNDSASLEQKAFLRGELKKASKKTQVSLEPVISKLSAMRSLRTTSKRTHDLKRLQRQSKIKDNVQAANEMTFEKLAEYLEDYASDMGVMVLNIDTGPFAQLLGSLTGNPIDAGSCCALDSRILYLEGLDAGIIMEQSQGSHNGPLRNQSGPLVPIMSMPYLNQGAGSGSMLAWVCWDEFVDLETPFGTRWMEKCNEAHISALRIIMRATLSSAVISRDYNINAGAPETEQLMGALLMASMLKLAQTRQSAPVEMLKAEDTVTKLIRGLFGNLLTVAGSGVRPLSMSWQLFGLEPQLDVPDSDQGWLWYQNIVALYPYSGWPLALFHQNLQNHLDKVIVRMLTRQVFGDAEMLRVPWQVGKAGEFGCDIEPLDEAFVEEMLTGEVRASHAAVTRIPQTLQVKLVEEAEEAALDQYKSSLAPAFVQSIERQMTPEDACTLMHVPVETMQVFAKALNPDFVWEDLSCRFKVVMMGLLANRSARIESWPVRKLFSTLLENSSAGRLFRKMTKLTRSCQYIVNDCFSCDRIKFA